MITASTYTLVVVPALILALSVGAVLWSNASTRRFDRIAAENKVAASIRPADLDSDLSSDLGPSSEDAFALGSGLSKSVLDQPLFPTPLTQSLQAGTRITTSGIVRVATSPDPKRSAESA